VKEVRTRGEDGLTATAMIATTEVVKMEALADANGASTVQQKAVSVT
jgi:hypothetical protein